jgi:hypothetical protein
MKHILCVDVGGTRIKATVLPWEINDIQTLQNAPKMTVRSLGWLNKSLPNIINKDNWASLINQETRFPDFDFVALCVPGLVKNGLFYRQDLGIPTDLHKRLMKLTERTVCPLIKDADAWTIGALSYLKMQDEYTATPTLTVVFGTGIGVSAASSSKTIDSIDISEWGHGFPLVEKKSGQKITLPWEIHAILGRQFFDWVGDHKRHWTYQRIREEFTDRLIALLKDLLPRMNNVTGTIGNVLIGGGNAEYASISTIESQLGIKVKSFSNRIVDLDPDLIPLLGLHQVAVDSRITINQPNF